MANERLDKLETNMNELKNTLDDLANMVRQAFVKGKEPALEDHYMTMRVSLATLLTHGATVHQPTEISHSVSDLPSWICRNLTVLTGPHGYHKWNSISN